MPPTTVTFPVRVMQALGVRHLILSNAAGGMNPAFRQGDLMVIKDHINLTGENPLIGDNDDDWGPRFPDMTAAYDRALAQCSRRAADSLGIALKSGVYAGLKGPSLETPAEIRYLQNIGADAVGFSTVMENIAAVHAGMRVLGLSTITNINDPDHAGAGIGGRHHRCRQPGGPRAQPPDPGRGGTNPHGRPFMTAPPTC
jgi:purine-nucleoside phosphorylase